MVKSGGCFSTDSSLIVTFYMVIWDKLFATAAYCVN